MAEIKVTTHYPVSEEWEYITKMVRINMDEERVNDVSTNKGFVVTSSKPIKDDIKDPDGIFSTRFGRTLQDIDPYSTRYKCKCGNLNSKFMVGQTCPICGEKVRYVDDDFSYFGWDVLKDPYYIIHPSLFTSLSAFIGSETFDNIIKIQAKKDEDGNDMPIKVPKGEPFYGIGMIEFHRRFNEIMEYYASKYRDKAKSPGNTSARSKMELYSNIMEDNRKVFVQSIPVFTTLLRPFKMEGEDLHYEKSNSLYKIITTLVERINKDNLRMTSKAKSKNTLLYDLQMKVKELSDEINSILSGKKGSVRQTFGGRYNYSARAVVSPSPALRADQVTLSYPCLCGLLQQRIINVLQKSHNMDYSTAYIYLERHAEDMDPLIVQIIEGFMKSDCEGKGIPVIINRNPTISMGGILQCYCIGFSQPGAYNMSLSLTILKGLAADFDGDTLNILYIINQDFRRAAELILNPVNSMQISKNDGMYDITYSHQRDAIINLNSVVRLCRDNYSKKQLDKIKAITKY